MDDKDLPTYDQIVFLFHHFRACGLVIVDENDVIEGAEVIESPEFLADNAMACGCAREK